MRLYLDASALVKRYVGEAGSDVVRRTMDTAEEWFMCRIGYLETARAVAIAAGRPAAEAFFKEWPSFGVIEVDEPLVEDAVALALDHDLRSMDSLHLAAALVPPAENLVFVSWDRRLSAAARSCGLSVLPEA